MAGPPSPSRSDRCSFSAATTTHGGLIVTLSPLPYQCCRSWVFIVFVGEDCVASQWVSGGLIGCMGLILGWVLILCGFDLLDGYFSMGLNFGMGLICCNFLIDLGDFDIDLL